MSYTPPQTIIEAMSRLYQGERFSENGKGPIYYHPENDDVMCANLKLIDFYKSQVKNWLPYKEPEPEFQFKFDDLVCMRFHDTTKWEGGRYSHLDNKYFEIVGGVLRREITTFSHDLLGKVCEPTTPVWIIREGKPCVKN